MRLFFKNIGFISLAFFSFIYCRKSSGELEKIKKGEFTHYPSVSLERMGKKLARSLGSKKGVSKTLSKRELQKKRLRLLAERILKRMTLREKISQILITYPPLPGKKRIEVGGVILLGSILRSEGKIIRRVRELQSRAKIPLIVAVDMEGGYINPLRRIRGLRKVPSPYTLSKLGRRKTFLWGEKIGKTLKRLGINCNFAPVLDLAERGFMFRYKRTFGSDPRKVAALAEAFIRGMRKYGIISIAKHFPGYGPLESNSDREIMIVKRSQRELKRHLSPFLYLKEQIDGVMMANIALLPFGTEPALFSDKIVGLAHRYNKDWIAITDDLCSKSLLKRFGGKVGRAVKAAFTAGNDLLLMTCLLSLLPPADDPRVVLAELIAKKPVLKRSLDRRVLKVLRLKLQYFWQNRGIKYSLIRGGPRE